MAPQVFGKLLQIFKEDSFEDSCIDYIHQLSSIGLSKKEIYLHFLAFHHEIQATSHSEVLYDRVSNFMDGFTTWEKDKKILPNEPDIS